MKYFNDIVVRLTKLEFPPEGSDLRLINDLEESLQKSFPLVYKEFLQLFGERSKHLFCGNIIETNNLYFIQKTGQKIYRDATGQAAPENALFFLHHQNYSFYYFILDGTENPDIYLLIWGDEITNTKIGKLKDLVLERLNSLEDR